MTYQSTDRHIDYVEFKTRDLAATKAFFNTVFGWEFNDYGPDYASFGGGLRGGFASDTGDQSGGPLVVLYADDLAATLARVKSGGGIISLDIFEFPGGKRFHFVEPGGNELAVWSE